VQEDQVHVGLAETMAGLHRLLRRVNQAEIDDLDAGPAELLRHARKVALQPLLEAGELRPIRIQPDPKETKPQRLCVRRRHGQYFNGPWQEPPVRDPAAAGVGGWGDVAIRGTLGLVGY